jgi:uncharacterized protein YggE
MRRFLTPLALIALMPLADLPAAAQEAPAGRLTVIGDGSVDTVPDMALISLGVTSAAEALHLNNDQQAAVIKSLLDSGVPQRNIQTSSLNLSPLYSNEPSRDGQPKITGYQASNIVTVKVLAITELGGMLDKVVTTGANQLNSLSFGLADPEPAANEARKQAVADAVAKAKLYAEAAGVKLGPIVRFQEGSAAEAPQPMFRRMASVAEAVPVSAGEVTVTAQVTITFALGQ